MPLKQRDLFLAGRDRLLALSDRYTPESIDKEGNDVNLFLNLVAGIGEELSLESGRQDNARYLSTVATVSDEAAERLGSDMTGGRIQRFRENATIVDLQWSRSNTYTLALAPGTVASTLGGVSYRTVDEVSWQLGDNAAKLVRAVCENTGVGGNAERLTITKPQQGLGDDTLSVTNPTAASGGREQETIPEYISRVRDWFVNAPRGTLSAIEFGARQTPGVVQATATEPTSPLPIFNLAPDRPATAVPFYRVRMTIADVAGQAGTALQAETRKTLEEYRCAGVPVLLAGGIIQYVTIRWKAASLVLGKNIIAGAVQSELTAKIVSAVAEVQPDKKLLRALLIAIAETQVDGIVEVLDDALITPAADVTPAPGYTIRVRSQDITYT